MHMHVYTKEVKDRKSGSWLNSIYLLWKHFGLCLSGLRLPHSCRVNCTRPSQPLKWCRPDICQDDGGRTKCLWSTAQVVLSVMAVSREWLYLWPRKHVVARAMNCGTVFEPWPSKKRMCMLSTNKGAVPLFFIAILRKYSAGECCYHHSHLHLKEFHSLCAPGIVSLLNL